MISHQESKQNAVIVTVLTPKIRPIPAQQLKDEARGLAQALDLEIGAELTLRLHKITPAYLFGAGQVNKIAEQVAILKADLAYIDHPLTPGQQANLEKKWKCKVLDRQGVILEIFGLRAQTKEGVLQVELARLNYERSRLVRTWTHLERQRGGRGFMGGAGETQLEADKRFFDARIKSMRRQLKKVQSVRQTQRRKRLTGDTPMIAFVGYTNAGKSTLFNAMTQANVHAKDELFATLDPTIRRVALTPSQQIYLSDTVGFIRDLPPELVAAFMATLEEVQLADWVAHIQDVADPLAAQKKQNVLDILERLGIESGSPKLLNIFNKIDLVTDEQCTELHKRAENDEGLMLVSAQQSQSVKKLKQQLARLVAATG